MLVFALSLLFIILYSIGVVDEELVSLYDARNEEEGLEGRSWRWGDAINKLLYYPFGWANNNTTFNQYVHNTWLDVARVTGIIPLLPICVITVKSLHDSYKLIRKDINYKYISLVGLNFCFMCTFMVEPIIEGFPLLFYLWFMLCGIQEEKLKN